MYIHTANIRAFLQLTTNVIDTCYDCRSGVKNTDVIEHLDLEQITDELRELRDVLEGLFKTAVASITLKPSADISELLSNCRADISRLRGVLQQDADTGSGSSFDQQMVLSNLAVNVTALRGVMKGGLG